MQSKNQHISFNISNGFKNQIKKRTCRITEFNVIQTINVLFLKVMFLQISPKMEIYNALGESKTFC